MFRKLKSAQQQFFIAICTVMVFFSLSFLWVLHFRLKAELRREAFLLLSQWVTTTELLQEVGGESAVDSLLDSLQESDAFSISIIDTPHSELPPDSGSDFSFPFQGKTLRISLGPEIIELGAKKTEAILGLYLLCSLVAILFALYWFGRRILAKNLCRHLISTAALNPLATIAKKERTATLFGVLEHLAFIQKLTSQLLNELPVPLFLTNTAGRYLFVNETYCTQNLGVLENELLYDGWLDFIHPDDLKNISTLWKKAVHNLEPSTIEFRLRNPDGFESWHRQLIQPLKDSKGLFFGFTGILLPLKSEKQLQKITQEQQEKLSLALEVSQLGVWSWDLKSDTTTYDVNWYRVFHYPSDTLIPSKMDVLVHPEDRKRCEALFAAVGKGKCESYQIDFRLKNGKGEWCWVREKGRVHQYDRSHNPQVAIGIHANIDSEIKHLQELNSLAEMVQFSHDAITRLDTDRKIITWSPAAQKLFQWHEGEMIGKTLAPLKINLARFDALLKKTKQKRQSESLNLEAEKKDGSSLLLAVRVSPLFDTKESFNGYAIVMRDETQTARLQKEEELFQLQLLEFISLLSHRLRTPITTIQQATASLVEKESEIPDPLHPILTLLDKNCNRIGEMIHDVLDYQGVAFHKGDPYSEMINLHDVLEEVSARHLHNALKKNIKIEHCFKAESPLIKGDRKKLLLAFSKIVENAVEYTKEGTITLSSEKRDHQLLIAICDTGAGISPDLIKKIFEPFFQQKAVFTEYGSGLGLAIAQKIVHDHGGSIECQSQGNQGSKFVICFNYDK